MADGTALNAANSQYIAVAYGQNAPVPPLTWTPPVMLHDFGKPRVVTQADVDRWIKIERAYRSLMRDLRNHTELFPDADA